MSKPIFLQTALLLLCLCCLHFCTSALITTGISTFAPGIPQQQGLLAAMLTNSDFFLPRLSSNDVKFLEMPCLCPDAHAQSCLPAAAMSSCGQLKAADKFLTLKVSPEMDWTGLTTPKWRGLSEAPRSASLTTHCRVHPSLLCATTSTWKSQPG